MYDNPTVTVMTWLWSSLTESSVSRTAAMETVSRESEKLWRSIRSTSSVSKWTGEGEEERGKHCRASEAQNSILQAGNDSSCMTTVLLEANTMMLRSCCLSWVCWYHSLVTTVSWVGIRVTWRARRGESKMRRGQWRWSIKSDIEAHSVDYSVNLHGKFWPDFSFILVELIHFQPLFVSLSFRQRHRPPLTKHKALK